MLATCPPVPIIFACVTVPPSLFPPYTVVTVLEFIFTFVLLIFPPSPEPPYTLFMLAPLQLIFVVVTFAFFPPPYTNGICDVEFVSVMLVVVVVA